MGRGKQDSSNTASATLRGRGRGGSGQRSASATGRTRDDVAAELSALTGIPDLDACLVDYASGAVPGPRGSVPVMDFRERDLASGNCDLLAHDFTAYLQGVPWTEYTRVELDGWDTRMGWTGSGEQLGYGALRGNHYLTRIVRDGTTYTVDWTAAQFGFADFPLVQRLGDDGRWVRLSSGGE